MRNLLVQWGYGDDFMFRWFLLFFCNGLANPYEATVALFSTMNSQFAGFLTRLPAISLLIIPLAPCTRGAQEEGEVLII